MSDLAQQRSLQHAGVTVHYSISPCSWMYAGYGLQIQMSLVEKACNAESVFVLRKDLPVTADGALKAAEEYLAEKGTEEMEKERDAWQVTKAKLRESADRESRARLAEFRAQLAKGFTHITHVWIHHKGGGSDRLVDVFSAGLPPKRTISNLLRGSVEKTDVQTQTLQEAIDALAAKVDGGTR